MVHVFPTVAGFRKSGYKQQKTNTAMQGTSGGSSGNNGGCRNCGGRHSSYTVQAREKECRAFNLECRKCGARGHFQKFCNKDKKVAATAAAAESEQPPTAPAVVDTENGAIEFCFFGVELTNRFAVLEGRQDNEEVRETSTETRKGQDTGWRTARKRK